MSGDIMSTNTFMYSYRNENVREKSCFQEWKYVWKLPFMRYRNVRKKIPIRGWHCKKRKRTGESMFSFKYIKEVEGTHSIPIFSSIMIYAVGAGEKDHFLDPTNLTFLLIKRALYLTDPFSIFLRFKSLSPWQGIGRGTFRTNPFQPEKSYWITE